MGSQYLQQTLRTADQVVGDAKRAQFAPALYSAPATYFILFDQGRAGMCFGQTEMAAGRDETIATIRRMDKRASPVILGVFRAEDGDFENVTSEIIREARALS